MYRTAVELVRDVAGAGVEDFALRLRFATISVDQFGSGSGGKTNIRPILGRVARFEWWPHYAGRDQFVESAGCTGCLGAGRNELRDHATMSRNRDTFAGFDPPDVTAQVVLEFPDAGGSHN
jgi:hypothetical protein